MIRYTSEQQKAIAELLTLRAQHIQRMVERAERRPSLTYSPATERELRDSRQDVPTDVSGGLNSETRTCPS